MTGWKGFSGVEKLGTLQMPFFRIFCQSSPSWISPRTPIFSMISPFSLGREGSTSGRTIAGVGVGVGEGDGAKVGIEVGLGLGQSPEAGDGVAAIAGWMTVEAIVEASESEVCGERR